MAVVLGRLLASAFLICSGTGLYSHFLQDPLPWMHFATRPAGLYQLTQGIHISAGIACFPLLLGKLHTVFPNLFTYPPIASFAHFLERVSITVFVSASLIQISTGLLDTIQWYPFPFNFRQTHFALSFVIIGSLAIHIACKLPVISRYWTRAASVDSTGALILDEADAPLTPEAIANKRAHGPEPVGPVSRRVAGLTGRVFDWIDGVQGRAPDSAAAAVPDAAAATVSRRGFVATIAVSTTAVVALTSGQSFAFLDGINVFAPRKKGTGAQSLPINRTARAAQVTPALVDSHWRLTLRNGDTVREFSRDELLALPQTTVQLPISCVEGWSQMATWTGVRLKDLVKTIDAQPDHNLRLTSLEVKGGYRVTEMGYEYVQDDLTLVALKLGGETLALDHGFPARMIAPGRPGVLQTKWLSRIEVI